MSEHFNFKQEVLTKYDHEVFEMFVESFSAMPISAIVDERIFAVHGGISEKLIEDGL
jgi:serine/threonine-protein phosphatase 2B catalytic subunit